MLLIVKTKTMHMEMCKDNYYWKSKQNGHF